jgi:hypothetical protein
VTENPSRSDTKLIVSDELAGVHPKIVEDITLHSDGFCMAYAG